MCVCPKNESDTKTDDVGGEETQSVEVDREEAAEDEETEDEDAVSAEETDGA